MIVPPDDVSLLRTSTRSDGIIFRTNDNKIIFMPSNERITL